MGSAEWKRLLLWTAGCVVIGRLLQPCSALAGMPAVLSEDIQSVFRLNDSSADRIAAISFFLVGLLICSWLVRLLWNYLAVDWDWMPRISFARSFAVVVLSGLFFLVVLTMISGARELMTPGAWEKQGLTFRLVESEGRPENRKDQASETSEDLDRTTKGENRGQR